MTQLNCKTINGYIEGYYGRLLSWENREKILIRLKKNNMQNYLYAPKEDLLHRKNWRNSYNKVWQKSFKLFCKSANSKKINILFGISPGLDFDFNNLMRLRENADFKILIKKCQNAIDLGANSIVLQLDDIPDHFTQKYKSKFSEGLSHAYLTNELSTILNCQVYVIPRIYSDELFNPSDNYLLEFGSCLDSSIKIFYCGINVVEKNINKNSKRLISQFLNNQIIFWDNFYANDYCPRCLFIGPWKGRANNMNIMINPTGMIETDLLIIDIVGNTLKNCNNITWETIIKKNNIPSEIFKIKKYFQSPAFSKNPSFRAFKYTNRDIKYLDKLLWDWHSEISREWYPFLMGLKIDLQLATGNLSPDRIIKTQTNPLADKIL